MTSNSDLKRLGRRGSYRLGQLRTQGTAPPGPPPPLRPRFRRARHQGPTALWLLAAAAGVAVIAGGAAARLWFVPFAAGLAAGLANRIGGWRARVLVPAVAAMAIAGWGIPLWWSALHGEPAGGTARVIAALAGLPASAAAGVLFTLLVGGLQGLAGLWLGRALTPPPRRTIPDAGMADADAPGAADAGAADVRALDARAADAGAADVRALDARAADARAADVSAADVRALDARAADVSAAAVRWLGAGASDARAPGGLDGGRADSPAPQARPWGNDRP